MLHGRDGETEVAATEDTMDHYPTNPIVADRIRELHAEADALRMARRARRRGAEPLAATQPGRRPRFSLALLLGRATA